MMTRLCALERSALFLTATQIVNARYKLISHFRISYTIQLLSRQ